MYAFCWSSYCTMTAVTTFGLIEGSACGTCTRADWSAPWLVLQVRLWAPFVARPVSIYRVIRNDCRGFNNCHLVLPMQLHVISFCDATPCDFFLWGYVKDQVYAPPLPASIPEPKVRFRTAIETITADMLQTWNELVYRVDVCRITKGCTYRAPVRYVTRTWSVVLLNKKNIYSYLKCIVYDKLLKPRQSFRITQYCAFYWCN